MTGQARAVPVRMTIKRHRKLGQIIAAGEDHPRRGGGGPERADRP
jgi:hypothetical protein